MSFFNLRSFFVVYKVYFMFLIFLLAAPKLLVYLFYKCRCDVKDRFVRGFFMVETFWVSGKKFIHSQVFFIRHFSDYEVSDNDDSTWWILFYNVNPNTLIGNVTILKPSVTSLPRIKMTCFGNNWTWFCLIILTFLLVTWS